MFSNRVREWALNVNRGMSYHAVDSDLQIMEDPTRTPPMYRTRQAMIAYAENRNRRRMRRLRDDYAWLRKCVEEMGLNPEDARFLL